ncbi:Putative GTP-binding protein 6 [Eufriesea mexicana]|uniref:GTP-binding protein 6 n=1 Tax=Eufriesea mexicana TaxID=516756 RepID=A0A310ST37_9HYME|nr:PREDICTED: putative GTP-binding protein 6 [Eufriesea mexicana]OAD59450.1 Putative GTP-binding protein 6 [Eufriesea mexicana]
MRCLKKFIGILNKSQYIINRKKEVNVFNAIYQCKYISNSTFQEYNESEEENKIYSDLCQDYLGTVTRGNRVFIIQPYIKWGVQKKRSTTPELQLAEAVALIDTLPYWSIVGKKIVPLLSLQKKQLVGSGTMETLKKDIRSCPHVTAIFVSANLLKFIQIAELQQIFNLPIYDRYSIIIHIFREHARTSEAKLQVALAEIPYIKKKMIDLANYRIQKRINFDDKTKAFLHARERKLKNALVKLKEHRQLIKRQRCRYGFPNIAIVGYTNAGKTSLIKALTGDVSLQPENKLFATLDTTVHQGFLPNNMKVLYIDTIGFIQDVPETLIEPFRVTLEDAINAEIIIHVFDISHPDVKAQVQHVQKTIQSMVDENKLIINVANKCDLVEKNAIKSVVPEDAFIISTTKLTGLDLLRSKLEEDVINAANIIKKRIRVRTGSVEASWLYKQTTVLSAEPDSNNSQYLIMDILMTTPIFYEFKRVFHL